MPGTVSVAVDARRTLGAWRPIWNWFGYDEPNYSTMPHGRALLADLARLHDGPVYIRTHNLLTSGDGTPALKWGSTGVYREDAAGWPIYSWTILDGIFDAFVEAGVVPFVQVGFMPEALSTGGAPYRHDFPKTGITTGWAYPPKDYRRWGDLIEAIARHFADRYGAQRVAAWPWEIWNEPDGLYWKGTIADFCRLHDMAAAAIRRAIPDARLGGPHTCGPIDRKAADYLRAFLDHCSNGRNFATGETGSRLDFVAFHAKGRPALVDGRVRMGIARQLGSIAAGIDIVRAYPAFSGLPIILGESDPEGCAACSTATHPENAYRDGLLYGVSVVEAIARTLQLADSTGVRIEGAVTWAFEFENTPYFAGYRELATNGIGKPVLNAIRMLGMLKGERVAATSSGALPLTRILESGVTGLPDIDAIATRHGDDIAVLVWNYHDDDVPAEPAAVVLDIATGEDGAYLCRHYRVDGDHSNAHAVFLWQGAPQPPSAGQYGELLAASALQQYRDAERLRTNDGAVRLAFPLPRAAVSLIALEKTAPVR